MPFIFLILFIFGCAPQNPGNPPDIGPLPGLPENIDLFRDIALPVGSVVDGQFGMTELNKYREDAAYEVDLCDGSLSEQNSFSSRITYEVFMSTKLSKAELSYVSKFYGLPSEGKDFYPNSLVSHPLCEVSREDLSKLLPKRNMPSSETIRKANEFSSKINNARREAYSGSKEAMLALGKLWSKFFMCLAYEESLPTADSDASEAYAKKIGALKFPGVEFYYDRMQGNKNSKTNIGLFQFSPNSNGNIQACIREWNQRYSGCKIKQNETSKNIISDLSSPRQSFNSFCGVRKVVGAFSVQINTSKKNNSAPENISNDGELVPSAERCVTPFIGANIAYNHFGPLQNTVNNSLDHLLSCVLSE